MGFAAARVVVTLVPGGADGLLAGGVASVVVAALLALRVPGAGQRHVLS